MPDSLPLQWQRLLKNTGIWEGSFTQLSPDGQLIGDVRTEVSLLPQDNDRLMRQQVCRYPDNAPPQIQTLEYRQLNRATLFFETGAFSQGSMQWGPFSTFGAELGLIAGERRLRLVQLFDKARDGQPSTLQNLTLIREQLKGSTARERPSLQLADLLGTWQGEATTQFADLRAEQTQRTQLTIEQTGDQQVRQTLDLGAGTPPISSTGTVQGQKLPLLAGHRRCKCCFLPDGASATCPRSITPRQPLFLEVGWLLDAHTRQRLIRRYDAAGAWTSLTLVTEQK